MSRRIRYSRRRKMAFVLIALMLVDTILPTTVQALTSGASQPEVQSFEPVGTSNMVDMFSGDFTYNIPLFELPGPDGGYPFNLAYHGGVGMDQEATWTGLGWNINAGAINRSMRGIPDDFSGDEITKTVDVKPSFTVGIGAAWTPDVEAFGVVLKIKYGLTPYYNNYKGFGYSATVSPSLQFNASNGMTIGMGVQVKSDMYDGKTYSPNFSLSMEHENSKNDWDGTGVNFSFSYNARQGVTQIGLGITAIRDENEDLRTLLKEVANEAGLPLSDRTAKAMHPFKGETVGGTGSSISFNNSAGYVPKIENQMVGHNLDIGFKLGPTVQGIFTNTEIRGYYNIHKLSKDVKNRPVKTPAYGLINIADAAGSNLDLRKEEFNALLDFNREADGMINKETKNLPVPVITNDIYTIAGQGVGGRFTANKSTFGFIRDKSVRSPSNGGAIGIDIGPPATPGGIGHYGASGRYSHGVSHNHLFNFDEIAKKYSFENSNVKNDPYYEKTYFRPHGEITLEDPVDVNNYLHSITEPSYFPLDYKYGNKPKLSVDDHFYGIKENMKTKSGANHTSTRFLTERRKRNSNIEGVNNEYLIDNDKVLGELEVKCFDSINAYNIYDEQSFDKVNRKKGSREKHIGGFITVGANSTKYIYGLPAYNLKHEEHVFSVASPSSTDFKKALSTHLTNIEGNSYNHQDHGIQFKDVTEIPEYTHSHLLTSVLGSDYVDLTNNGPTEDDIGYWVKFNYVRTADYEWRNPFTNANYIPGQLSDQDDDKGHFMYGERENYYLATAETKTHIAEFKIVPRNDGRGWSRNAVNNLGANSYALTEINIYTKAERYHGCEINDNALPIRTVHFKYAHNDDDVQTVDLCQGVYNNPHSYASSNPEKSGKLTLTQLWFTARHNKRGENNKFYFEYENNPSYSTQDYDCWGNYRDNGKIPAPEHPVSYPYVAQDYNNHATSHNDLAANAWNLNRIIKPTGSTVEIVYESDDYAYVQNKKAMEMYKLSDNQNPNEDGSIPSCIGRIDEENSFLRDDIGDFVRVDIPEGMKYSQIPNLFDHTGQLYFKVLSPLIQKRSTDGTGSAYSEYVTGYANIDMVKTLAQFDLTDDNSIDAPLAGIPPSVKIYLLPFKEGRIGERHHPITLAIMDYLQLSRTDLIYLLEAPLPSTRDLDDDSKEQRRDKLKAMLSPIFNMLSFNQNFYSNANCRSGNKFIINHSFVRLNNLNGFKEGGGIRVKKITEKKHINDDEKDAFGTVYDYTTIDDLTGEIISSGVATNEPSIGKEQNALKRGLEYDKEFKLKTEFKLFTEYPYNESYFPGASVGYSKVTVKSLNTHAVERNALKYTDVIDLDAQYTHKGTQGISITGTTVNEFYTAKDYPVYSTATDLGIGNSLFEYHSQIIVPILGSNVHDMLIASQGYLIELNDMHGKQKAVHTYGHNQKGVRLEQPLSSINYYFDDYDDKINNLSAKRLNSEATALLEDGRTKEMLMGLDYNFFYDVRSSFNQHFGGGLSFNQDFLGVTPFIIPLINMIDGANNDKKEMKYIVTNKIVWRTGILKETVVKNENSTIRTRNTHFDALTGAPLLTEVENNFDDVVFNLTIPGYWKYEGMGPAYKNTGLKLEKCQIKKDAKTEEQEINKLYTVTPPLGVNAEKVCKDLYPGDEFLVEVNKVLYKAYVMRVGEKDFKIDFDMKTLGLQEDEKVVSDLMYLTRSGRRNLLSVQAGSVTTLVNPLNDNPLNCIDE